MWAGIAGIREVERLAALARVRKDQSSYPAYRTIIIPLLEQHAKDCPRRYRALVPERAAVDSLCNKAMFAAFVREHGLSALSPETYASVADAVFPCVLKRVDLSGGFGIEIVRSPRQLQALLGDAMWKGRDWVIQSLVAGIDEYATNCICRDGRILWHASYAYRMDHDGQVRRGVEVDRIRRFEASAPLLRQMERFLAPLRYGGPCNVNYKMTAAGQPCIFEINPRFGGSLMLPDHRAALREALACLIANASLPS